MFWLYVNVFYFSFKSFELGRTRENADRFWKDRIQPLLFENLDLLDENDTQNRDNLCKEERAKKLKKIFQEYTEKLLEEAFKRQDCNI